MAESNQAMLERSMRSVFVGNIPFDLTEEKLKEIFSEVGPVLSFKLVYDRENGKPKGYGFCEYKDIETGNSALRNLNGYEIGGRILKVDNAANEKTRMEMQNILQLQEAANQESVFEHLLPEEAPEAISKAVASLPPEQMFELMKQMKQCVQNNPSEARTMLLQNPQLAYALLQAQVVMRIVDPQVAVSMLHKANVIPEHHPPDSIHLMHQPIPPVIRPDYLPPQMQQQMPPMQQMQQQQQMQQSHEPMDRPLDPRMARNPQPPMDTDLRFGNQMPLPGPVMPPLTNQHFPTGPSPNEMMMRDPRQGPPMPVPMPVAPPRDPRGQSMDHRPQGPPRQAPPPTPVPAPVTPPTRGGVPNLGNAVSDQEKAALIMQVLQLSDEQIAMLPPEQRQSILVLKEQIAKSHR